MKSAKIKQPPVERLFRNPPPEYGDLVTWFWESGRLTKERLSWQLEQFKKQGVGGTYFYPRLLDGQRYGTHPAYFTEEWWDFFRHAAKEHKRLGLLAGFSAWEGRGDWRERLRKEREAHPEITGRRLAACQAESTGPGPLAIEVPKGEQALTAAAYRVLQKGAPAAQREGGGLTLLDGDSRQDVPAADSRIEWKAPAAGWRLVVVCAQPHDLDYLSPCVMDRWIEMYWQVHERKLGGLMGKPIRYYMQDEMPVLDGNILYNERLRDRFVKEKGYDPLPHLAGLFEDIGDFTDKIRCDYYEVMSALLEENFYKRITDWLEARGMQNATIATWGRQDPLSQTWHYGDFFRLMRWFHVTGNEDPCRRETGGRCFIDAKFSSSIREIYGRDRAAFCVYWDSGWGMTQEENLAWTHENLAYGLNLYNQHGGLYSTLGSWHEWVPPSIHGYQPYYAHWKTFVDYVARLCAVLSQGKHRADAAILYPLTTIHAGWLRGGDFTVHADDASVATLALAQDIYRRGTDFDFVNDDVLSRAEVEDGKLKVAGLEFRAVVLPPMTTIRRATLERIKSFYDAGGAVVAYRRLPSASPEAGRNDPVVRRLVEAVFGVTSSENYSHATKLHCQGRDRVHQRVNERGGKAFFVPGDTVRDDARRLNPSVADALRVAFAPDVSVQVRHLAQNPDVFHTHRKIGERDVYFLFNLSAERRDMVITFRMTGRPEIWDARTGRMRPVHRFVTQGEHTTIRLAAERHEGILIAFSPAEPGPSVMEDDLAEVESVTPRKGGIRIRGLADEPGLKSARVAHNGRTYTARARVSRLPEPMTLGGEWEFCLKPTLDNRWGDFRWPASREVIGAEAREFLCREEGSRPGSELGWHLPDCDTSEWRLLAHSFGPYWHTTGPFEEGGVPPGLLADALAGRFGPEARPEAGRWTPYVFSQQFGREVGASWGVVEGVRDEFLVFDMDKEAGNARPGVLLSEFISVKGCPADRQFSGDPCRCIATWVRAPGDASWNLHLGAADGRVRQAWVNGSRVYGAPDDSAEKRAVVPVELRAGLNTVVVELEHTNRGPVRAYAVFEPPAWTPDEKGPPDPLLKWFRTPTGLTYDIMPRNPAPVGWCRFDAPAGARVIRVATDARRVQAWLAGRPVAVRRGRIELRSPLRAISTMALRIEQKPGVYGAAAVPEPVRFECGTARLPLGDWCYQGLASYSGAAVYSRSFRLSGAHLRGRVILDLGLARVVARVVVNGKTVGVGLTRPFRFDITRHARKGVNRIEATVYNTLANHYAHRPIPSAYVYDGQTVSGLIGPVTLRFPAVVEVTARPEPA